MPLNIRLLRIVLINNNLENYLYFFLSFVKKFNEDNITALNSTLKFVQASSILANLILLLMQTTYSTNIELKVFGILSIMNMSHEPHNDNKIQCFMFKKARI